MSSTPYRSFVQHGAAAQGPSRCHGEFGLAQQPADGEAAAGPARFLPQPGVEIDGQPVRIVSRRRSVEGRCQQCCRILAGRCRKRNVEIERRVEQAGAELQERRLMVVALHEQPHGGEQAGKMVATALPHQGGKVFKRESDRGEIGQAAFGQSAARRTGGDERGCLAASQLAHAGIVDVIDRRRALLDLGRKVPALLVDQW